MVDFFQAVALAHVGFDPLNRLAVLVGQGLEGVIERIVAGGFVGPEFFGPPGVIKVGPWGIGQIAGKGIVGTDCLAMGCGRLGRLFIWGEYRC